MYHNIFFCKIRNQTNATIPFSILEMLIAHQTPVMPSPIAVNPIAIGIRRLLNVMLMMAGDDRLGVSIEAGSPATDIAGD